MRPVRWSLPIAVAVIPCIFVLWSCGAPPESQIRFSGETQSHIQVKRSHMKRLGEMLWRTFVQTTIKHVFCTSLFDVMIVRSTGLRTRELSSSCFSIFRTHTYYRNGEYALWVLVLSRTCQKITVPPMTAFTERKFSPRLYGPTSLNNSIFPLGYRTGMVPPEKCMHVFTTNRSMCNAWTSNW